MRTIIVALACFIAGVLTLKYLPFPIPFLQSETEQFLIIGHLKKVAKLQTVEYKGHEFMEKTISDWAGAKTTMSFLAIGTVKASIDLEKMEVEQDKANKLIKIKLPPASVAQPTADKFAEICKSKQGFGREPTKAERTKWHDDAFAKIKSAAIKENIKGIALSKAKSYLTAFIEGFGWKVEFV